MDINNFFKPGGLLSQQVQHYETRPQQMDMANLVAENLNAGNITIIEAGTGVGKSLAYLIPAVLWSVKENTRIVVSTYSKALQQQLTEKELPFLKKHFEPDFNYAIALGGQNYLCLRRFAQLMQHDLFESKKEAKQMGKLLKWKEKTVTGLKTELDFDIIPSLWSRVCRESDICLRGKCTYITECLYNKQRQKLRSANILVVNHHLFFAHLAAGESILPQYEGIIFDEAHCLEESALDHLGIEVSSSQIKFLADGISSANGKGLIWRFTDNSTRACEKVKQLTDELRYQNDLFFQEIKGRFDTFPVRIKSPHWTVNTLGKSLKDLAQALKQAKGELRDEVLETETEGFIKRTREFSYALETLIEMNAENYVYWIESDKQRISLKASSIDVGKELRNILFNGEQAILLTSATLTAEKSFDYLQERLGIEQAQTRLLDSPFEYKKNALIYMTADLTDPKTNPTLFEMESIQRIAELVEVTGGKTLVLFTNFRYLERSYDQLKEMLPHINWFKQGELPHYRLIEMFRQNESSVLLGTNSFWQGVDIAGDALLSVIITKLPFAVPDDPLTEAKTEYLRRQGKEPFSALQIPQAIIWLKQGFGRLIRSKRDRGIVSILDPRILTRSYGRKFIKSLPETLYTTRIGDISKFLAQTNGSGERDIL